MKSHLKEVEGDEAEPQRSFRGNFELLLVVDEEVARKLAYGLLIWEAMFVVSIFLFA